MFGYSRDGSLSLITYGNRGDVKVEERYVCEICHNVCAPPGIVRRAFRIPFWNVRHTSGNIFL